MFNTKTPGEHNFKTFISNEINSRRTTCPIQKPNEFKIWFQYTIRNLKRSFFGYKDIIIKINKIKTKTLHLKQNYRHRRLDVYSFETSEETQFRLIKYRKRDQQKTLKLNLRNLTLDNYTNEGEITI